MEDAKRLFFAAVAGEEGALVEALAILEDLRAAGDNCPHVTAYLGAVRLLSAPRAAAPWEMGRRTRDGIGLMDRAVAELPDDVELRALRGLSYFRMPGFIGRGRVAADDLARAAAQAPAAAQSGRLDPALAAAALYHHGLVRERDRDVPEARAALRQAVEIAPESSAGRAAAERLARMQPRGD